MSGESMSKERLLDPRTDINHRDDPMVPFKFTLTIERGKKGLWYATSAELPGLLVAENTWRKAVYATPKGMTDLFLAARLAGK
jgi:hypothetical protein